VALRHDFPERARRAGKPLSCRDSTPVTLNALRQRLRKRESRRKVALEPRSG
jgi:hypothetical protein